MINLNDFRTHGHQLIDWVADYFENIQTYPVQSQVAPGDILQQLPAAAPAHGEDFDRIFEDFQKIIMPGITHWQHPGWHGYFTANNSYPSVLAELLTAALGAQCMSWSTSPAATELEQRVMEWLRDMTGLPRHFSGVIQDSASTATLVSLLTARETKTNYAINAGGFQSQPSFTLYCSEQAHSSIERAVKIAGFGRESLRKIAVDENFALLPTALDEAIISDLSAGHVPLAVIAAIGTTGSTAVDPLKEIGTICQKHNLWLHVDAAWAGSAMVLPELRYMIDGVEMTDSYVFNPHKWMFTNFDASAYFVADKAALIRTFEILPEYLKTKEGDTVNNYRDWGIQLGRRFRALKLWFVIRSYGVDALRQTIGNHIRWATDFGRWVDEDAQWELLAPAPLATACFRYNPHRSDDEAALNKLNQRLLESVNRSGMIFISHTTLGTKYTLRMVVGQTHTQQHHVALAWEVIKTTARKLEH
ncbi:MAG: pyridoxal-dependent decarboxylase [Bacteroidales bacterium]|nr:pyridoxal-dependent decarboxylase [Bacteroidales bacterium]MDD3130491.1 pyridoxal-dependent decarboxylase [Bacteroidales bacterium]NLO50669.1 aspartate aminotransferase family protein [Bacteroidales bacterium]